MHGTPHRFDPRPCVGGGGVASLVEDSPHKALSSPEVSKALASALMRVLSEGIEHTTGLFCRLQANCVFFVWFLAGRDAVLAFSTLPERGRANLRALPSNSSEFFGPESAAVFIS